jgi:hypothetical protein
MGMGMEDSIIGGGEDRGHINKVSTTGTRQYLYHRPQEIRHLLLLYEY